MKILGLLVVVVLGLVVGLWWTDDAPSRPASNQAAELAADHVAERAADPSRARRAIGLRTDRFPEIAKRERPTLEPTEKNDPKRREFQEALWRDLRAFANEAKLTDAQWDQFVGDLSDLASTESAAIASAVAPGGDVAGAFELNDELGHELEARCAEHMTEKQLRVFRFRFHADGLVAQVRRLHFVPVVTPET